MKKIFIIFIMIILCFIFTSCRFGQNYFPKHSNYENEVERDIFLNEFTEIYNDFIEKASNEPNDFKFIHKRNYKENAYKNIRKIAFGIIIKDKSKKKHQEYSEIKADIDNEVIKKITDNSYKPLGSNYPKKNEKEFMIFDEEQIHYVFDFYNKYKTIVNSYSVENSFKNYSEKYLRMIYNYFIDLEYEEDVMNSENAYEYRYYIDDNTFTIYHKFIYSEGRGFKEVIYQCIINDDCVICNSFNNTKRIQFELSKKNEYHYREDIYFKFKFKNVHVNKINLDKYTYTNDWDLKPSF